MVLQPLETIVRNTPTYGVITLSQSTSYIVPELRLKRGQVLVGNRAQFYGRIFPSVDSRISGIRFKGSGSGVTLENCWCVTLRDCFGGTVNTIPIVIQSQNSVCDVTIERWRIDAAPTGVFIHGGAHITVRIIDSTIESCGIGVHIAGYAVGTRISGNYFEANSIADVIVEGGQSIGTVIAYNTHVRSACPAWLKLGSDCTMIANTIRGVKPILIEPGFVRARQL